MAIPQLKIIGERINPGFKSSLSLFENSDLKGIQELAKKQVISGACALNINIGDRALKDSKFMADVIRSVQDVVAVPLSFDFPNKPVQENCLHVYDQTKAGGAKPIVNSISELRWEMLDLLKIRPFKLILMASERVENDKIIANKTSDEVYETTKRMIEKILKTSHLITIDDIIVDVSVGPVSSDTEDLTKMAIESIRKIGSDKDLKGVHMSVGLSNISIMLPNTGVDGLPLKPQVESAFLTMTVPYGLDFIIGTAGRNYELLPEDNRVLKIMKEAMEIGGFDALMKIQELYLIEN